MQLSMAEMLRWKTLSSSYNIIANGFSVKFKVTESEFSGMIRLLLECVYE